MSTLNVSEETFDSKCHVEVKTVGRLLRDEDNMYSFDSAYLTTKQYFTWHCVVNSEHSHKSSHGTLMHRRLSTIITIIGDTEFGQTE